MILQGPPGNRDRHAGTRTIPCRDVDFLRADGWKESDMWAFARHAERLMFQACPDRKFRRMWIKKKDGSLAPRYRSIDDYLVSDKGSLAWCQYAYLTSYRVSCFVVVDCDIEGPPSRNIGGHEFDRLAPAVVDRLRTLVYYGLTPAWIGVNPLSGKCQLIWYIEKVYTSKNRTSPNSRLLTALHTELTEFFGADRHFSHGISRWPFYGGDDMTAYRWHNQHHTVVKMGSMVRKVRTIMGKPPTAHTENVGEKQYSSGWERIEAARASAAQGRMLEELDRELLSADDAASDLIDGVRVRWIAPGRAARDETAFRHALAEGHRLHGAGSPMKDNLLIDAYERAYMVAQAVGADGREPEIPPMRDRLTMARRVRGYVVNGKPSRTQRTVERQSSAGRKALATMGRRGGKKAAQRWKDPNSDYAKQERAKLAKANQRRVAEGSATRARILAIATQTFAETGRMPSGAEIGREIGVTRKTACQYLRELRSLGLLPE